MARVFSSGRPVAVLGLLSLIIFFLLLGYGVYAAAVLDKTVKLGVLIYLLCIGTMILGFASREDSVAIGAVVGLNLLVILDIALRIGVIPGPW